MSSRSFSEGKLLKSPDEAPGKANQKRRPLSKPKPNPQRKQPKPKQQQQQQQQQLGQQQQPLPPNGRDTPGELLQNPPRLSSPVKGASEKAKVKFVLPKITPKKKRRRRATLWDVIARRVGPHGFHKNQAYSSKYRDTASSGHRILAPEEVLFKRPVHWNNRLKGEPYLKADKLSPDNPTDQKMKYPKNKFPDNDLLAAIHAYASDKYIHTRGKIHRAFVSMDESALLAFGILVEEMSKDAVGQKGDISLLRAAVPEAEENRRIDSLEWWFRGHKRRRSDKLVRENYDVIVRGDMVQFIRKRKRRSTKAKDGEGTERSEDTDGQSVTDPPQPPRLPRYSQPRKRRRTNTSKTRPLKKYKSDKYVTD